MKSAYISKLKVSGRKKKTLPKPNQQNKQTHSKKKQPKTSHKHEFPQKTLLSQIILDGALSNLI